MTRVALYPGSFDPPTKGHEDLVRRSLALADRLIVAIATNGAKQPLFTVEERLGMLREAVADARKAGAADAYTRERLADMLQFFELMTSWTEQTRKLPTPAIIRMVKMGDKLARLL